MKANEPRRIDQLEAEHQARREAKRQQRLRDLLSPIPHIKRSAQVFDERAYREATEAAQKTSHQTRKEDSRQMIR
jgi:hypothetical protein